MDYSPESIKSPQDAGPARAVQARELPLLGPSRRERSDAVRNRGAILCAAQRLVAERGVDAVTMDEVACSAGVGKGTLFRRFGDRSGLLRALLDERERDFQEQLIRGAPPLGPGVPAPARLIAFGERRIEEVEIQGAILLAAEAGAPGARLVHSVYAAHRAHVKALLLDAVPEADVEYIADVLLSALAAELMMHQRHVLEIPVERLKDGWKALVEGILERAASLEETGSSSLAAVD